MKFTRKLQKIRSHGYDAHCHDAHKVGYLKEKINKYNKWDFFNLKRKLALKEALKQLFASQ